MSHYDNITLYIYVTYVYIYIYTHTCVSFSRGLIHSNARSDFGLNAFQGSDMICIRYIYTHTRIPSYSQNMQNAAVDFDPRTQMYQYSRLASVTEYGGLSSRATPTYAPRLLLILM